MRLLNRHADSATSCRSGADGSQRQRWWRGDVSECVARVRRYSGQVRAALRLGVQQDERTGTAPCMSASYWSR